MTSHSRDARTPEFLNLRRPSLKRGRRECQASDAPQPRVRKVKRTRVAVRFWFYKMLSICHASFPVGSSSMKTRQKQRAYDMNKELLRTIIKSGTFILCLLMPNAARSIELRSAGQTLYLSGKITAGDQFKFRDFIADKPFKVVDLNSGGGNIEAAGEIGRQIRSKKMATLVDAARSRCGSACTVLFASGATRHYVNATGVKDGVGETHGRGLGFHEGNSWLSNGKKGQSGASTASMNRWYSEFGFAPAAPLNAKSDWKHFYYVSPSTASSLGLTTSNTRP